MQLMSTALENFKLNQVKTKPSLHGTEILIEDFTYITKDNWTIFIEKGFETDAATIPKIFWSIWPPFYPDYKTASIVHDYLCKQKEYKFADSIFKEILEINNDRFTVFGLHSGVVLWHSVRYYLPQVKSMNDFTNLKKEFEKEITKDPILKLVYEYIAEIISINLMMLKNGKYRKYIKVIMWLKNLNRIRKVVNNLKDSKIIKLTPLSQSS